MGDYFSTWIHENPGHLELQNLPEAGRQDSPTQKFPQHHGASMKPSVQTNTAIASLPGMNRFRLTTMEAPEFSVFDPEQGEDWMHDASNIAFDLNTADSLQRPAHTTSRYPTKAIKLAHYTVRAPIKVSSGSDSRGLGFGFLCPAPTNDNKMPFSPLFFECPQDQSALHRHASDERESRRIRLNNVKSKWVGISPEGDFGERRTASLPVSHDISSPDYERDSLQRGNPIPDGSCQSHFESFAMPPPVPQNGSQPQANWNPSYTEREQSPAPLMGIPGPMHQLHQVERGHDDFSDDIAGQFPSLPLSEDQLNDYPQQPMMRMGLDGLTAFCYECCNPSPECMCAMFGDNFDHSGLHRDFSTITFSFLPAEYTPESLGLDSVVDEASERSLMDVGWPAAMVAQQSAVDTYTRADGWA